VIICLIPIAGWVVTTWLRIKHGYPLDGAWGQAIYPKSSDETIERIVTDEPAKLAQQIDQLKHVQ
jgi:hypothetical protein